jgi:hypothetical protein
MEFRVAADEERRWPAFWRVFWRVSSLASTAERSLEGGCAGMVAEGGGEGPVGRDPEKEFLRIPGQRMSVRWLIDGYRYVKPTPWPLGSLLGAVEFGG